MWISLLLSILRADEACSVLLVWSTNVSPLISKLLTELNEMVTPFLHMIIMLESLSAPLRVIPNIFFSLTVVCRL